MNLDAHPASHWRNSTFQLEHFLLGRAHTPDEKYRVLCEQRENRILALNAAQVGLARAKAKRACWRLVRWVPLLGAFARAALLEQDLATAFSAQLIEAAVYELRSIELAIYQIEPQRKHKDVPNNLAHQLAQREQWAAELKFRGENFLLGSGCIPPEEIATMRLHPDWESIIQPHVRQFHALLTHMHQKGLTIEVGREAVTFVPHIAENQS